MLEDMAILTGGQLIAEEIGAKLENIPLKDLGRCTRVVMDKDNTTIVGGAGRSRTSRPGSSRSRLRSRRRLRLRS